MTPVPKVFIDTSVHKHAVRSRTELQRPAGALTWSFVEEDPVAVRAVTGELRIEIELLHDVAQLARDGVLELVTHLESLWELLGITLVPERRTSVFEGISIGRVPDPIRYSRMLTSSAGSLSSPRSLTYEFLQSLDHPRFEEVRKACGACQGERPAPPSQLIDAFLLWCADAAGVPYFLTTDLKLVRTVSSCKSVHLTSKVVAPSGLLRAVRGQRGE